MRVGITLSGGPARVRQQPDSGAAVWPTAARSACRITATSPSTSGFDKIASVGMFEHVGKRNLPTYFDKITGC